MKPTSTFYDWFMSRQRAIVNGSLGGQASTEAHLAAGEFRLVHKHDDIIAAVRTYALAEPNNPFAALRAMHHFKQGIAEIGDYSGSPHTREWDTINPISGEPMRCREIEYQNRKVPCAN